MHTTFWPAAWVASWLAALLSGTLLTILRPRRHLARLQDPAPGGFGHPVAIAIRQAHLVRLHIGLLWLPIAASLGGLALAPSLVVWGPWQFDTLGWSMSLYIALLSVMIQTFSVRYLHGDRAYSQYFTGLTWVTAAAAATWMSGHLALFAGGWTAMGIALTGLIGLKREWAPARAVAVLVAKRFLLSAAAVSAAAVWIEAASGSWRVSIAMSHASTFTPWARAGISGLLILAALIQAGGWPFQRWLMESAATPTPVSAVMHAGLVNAGGLLLTRMAPLFDRSGLLPHLALLGFAWLSVWIGTGIMLVHVDYKRQLIASTMAQMGLMLTQCALGAYDAAVVHLVLHGLFKATLFLRSGSVVPRPDRVLAAPGNPPRRLGRPLAWGVGLAVILGAAYWALAPGEPARGLSGLFLGAGVVLAWRHLDSVREGRWLGLGGVAIAVLVAEWVRGRLTGFVHDALQAAGVIPAPAAAPTGLVTTAAPAGLLTAAAPSVLPTAAFVLFAGGALAMARFAARPRSLASNRLYMRLVQLGEPRPEAMEPHPHYLVHYLKEAILR